ncbi:hypothetical protein HBH1_04504 [Herbaspirillum sp. BH-1]|uniref:2-keto-4-pentenoate hydratase/2-oxohepta-3-ene-1,7-dioic acid hydratase in catechol pathway n=1 Tax=Herbaspirillum frisingense TaxID=92645 RepID=A0ABU1PGX9_9BURK|nr:MULTISPECIES: fumarylacetoacetate hydrolase family protein [Herbaspirillum]MDR6585203.1 2-keto-4-pentenoate hydratase/2-oxohepta-3-ene-1,7-dioic acid hydratase in catechol pathway [Herbaspirillum frisingense]PLY57197.1 hypothetical protein HBH1_04504 [Herbaspirillum sp. BH-1]
MKLLSFHVKGGAIGSYGIATDQGIVDIGARLRDRYPDLKALLAGNAIDAARALCAEHADYSFDDVVYLPVIEHPGKIFGVGMNYQDKRAEFAESNPAPTLFVRFADSQTGHLADVIKPAESQELDYEGELAMVIGRGGKRIRREDAYSHIAGYSCYMDGSVRDWQHAWFTAGKNWPQTGAFGPWLVTPDELPDPHKLVIETFLNGQRVQNDNTGSMIRHIPELVEYISTFSELAPGDVILTGSPGGVGKKRVPQLFLQHGDVIEVRIEKIGTLKNRVVAAEPNCDTRKAA